MIWLVLSHTALSTALVNRLAHHCVTSVVYDTAVLELSRVRVVFGRFSLILAAKRRDLLLMFFNEVYICRGNARGQVLQHPRLLVGQRETIGHQRVGENNKLSWRKPCALERAYHLRISLINLHGVIDCFLPVIGTQEFFFFQRRLFFAEFIQRFCHFHIFCKPFGGELVCGDLPGVFALFGGYLTGSACSPAQQCCSDNQTN